MEFTERIKIALNYAEESSKRARWIVFMLQLAVVVVIASLWQQADSNWIQQRLYAAQDLTRILNCKPELIYGQEAIQYGQKTLPAAAGISRIDPEYLDSKYYCSEILKDAKRIERAENYHKDWGYSLTEAKKNVADLQQVMVSRVLGVSIPVLGVVFDVNDLSVLSGVTFVILLSWFHFALRRQNKNITHVFDIARRADLSGEEKGNCLSAAYYLLAMTQVLTIPPSQAAELEKAKFFNKIARLPSLIMWTAVIAQILVLWDDFLTMSRGNTLNVPINYFETGLAVALLGYLVLRTLDCYRFMTATQSVWDDAFKDSNISPEVRRQRAQQETVTPKPPASVLSEAEIA